MEATPGVRNRPSWRFLGFSHEPPERVLTSLYIFIILAAIAALGISVHLASAIISGTADDINKLLLSLAGIIGVPFLAWRTLLAAEQVSIARESHYTSLFTKAIEQLGATKEVKRKRESAEESIALTEPNLEVRLGAIYALERIASDSRRDHWPIIETLCAYVRENSPAGPEYESIEKRTNLAPLSQVRVDIQAALTVIGRRPPERIEFEREQAQAAGREHDGFRLDFRGTNLQRVDLSYGSFGRALFDGSDLRGAKIWATDLNQSSFVFTKFADVPINFSFLSHCSFSHAHLQNVIISRSCISASKFEMTQLSSCQFVSSDVQRSSFVRALGSMAAVQSNFRECLFEQTYMDDWSFTDCDLTAASFSGAHIGYPGLSGTRFTRPEGLVQAQID